MNLLYFVTALYC